MTPVKTTADQLKKDDTIEWLGAQSVVQQVITRTDGKLIIEHRDQEDEISYLTLNPDSVIDVMEAM